MVRNVSPLVPEDATQRHVHHPTGIVRLRAHVKNGNDHTDEDEPKGAIDTGRYADIDWEADMVECCASGVEKNDDAAQTCADERCNGDGIPGQAYGEQA